MPHIDIAPLGFVSVLSVLCFSRACTVEISQLEYFMTPLLHILLRSAGLRDMLCAPHIHKIQIQKDTRRLQYYAIHRRRQIWTTAQQYGDVTPGNKLKRHPLVAMLKRHPRPSSILGVLLHIRKIVQLASRVRLAESCSPGSR